jgi:hypothetical protein
MLFSVWTSIGVVVANSELPPTTPTVLTALNKPGIPLIPEPIPVKKLVKPVFIFPSITSVLVILVSICEKKSSSPVLRMN